MSDQKINKRIIAFLLCMLCLFPLGIVAARSESAELPSVDEAEAIYFYHLDSNTMVCEKNISQSVSAGSTVKIMAGLLFCEQLVYRTHERVEITQPMVDSVSGYRMYLKIGDVLTVEQLLYAAICGSYNDAYYALACYLSESVDNFVKEMNAYASKLGATDTHFTDPSGIDDGSVTTAYDLALIAKTAYQNELYMKICDTEKYSFSGSYQLAARTIYNRNALISSGSTTKYYNAKCNGMSAGSTSNAGNCVVTTSHYNNESYLCIVLGAIETDDAQFGYIIANRLIDWVYHAYTYMEVIDPEQVIATLPVTVSDFTTAVDVKANEALLCYLPKGLEIGKDIVYSVRLIHTELEAPVSEGELVGYVAVIYQGKVLGTLPLYTAGTAERSSVIGSLKNIQSITKNRVFVSGAIFFCVAFSGWMITEYILLVRRRHKWDKYFSNKNRPQI